MLAAHQDRLPKERAAQGIDTMQQAKRYLDERDRAAFDEAFARRAPAEPGAAFVPFVGPALTDIGCEHHERTIERDNCVGFEGRRLWSPARLTTASSYKARVRVHRYPDGRMAVFHGPGKLAADEPDGSLVTAPAGCDV